MTSRPWPVENAEHRRLWPAVLVAWALGAVMLSLTLLPMIVRQGFHDPDDAMRLLEVRDWLGGQSWWDVGQHRLGGGQFSMHWSRLVDLPIAGVILAVRPLLGAGVAERVAMVVVPLAQLLAAIALVALQTRRLAGHEAATLAALIVPITAPIVAQLQPMRIDHHGWQIVLALAASVALLSRPTARSGALAGLAAAVLVTISIEGLPFVAALLGVAAAAWAFDASRRVQLLAMAWTLALAAAALQAATRGPAMFAPACDAMAPSWIGVLGASAAGITAATLAPGDVRRRWIALVFAGVTVAAVSAWLAQPCLASGPYGDLDPLVRSVWFDHIAEGLPLWHQRVAPALITYTLPLVGLVGTWRGVRDGDGALRTAWLMLGALLAVATLLAVLTLRAGGTANALALPGAATIVITLLHRARARPQVVPRLAGTIGAFAVAAPGLIFPLLAMLVWPAPAADATIRRSDGRILPSCEDGHDVAALAQLPPSRLFAPLNIGPEILVRSGNEAVASGYHRNVAAIHRVLGAFLGSPAQARAAIGASGAHYVVGCPGLDETRLYDQLAPNGFWARLERGERFDWLSPAAIHGSPVLAWRVVAPAPLSRVPAAP